MPNLNFDARGVPPATGYEAVPTGKYAVFISDVNDATSSKPGVSGVKIEMTVAEGPMQGKKIYHNLWTHHPESAQTVDIAWKQLSAYCHVTGVLYLQTGKELVNHRLIVNVVTKDGNSNITAIYDQQGNEAGKQQGAGQQQQAGMPGMQQPMQQPQQGFQQPPMQQPMQPMGMPQQPAQMPVQPGMGMPGMGGMPNGAAPLQQPVPQQGGPFQQQPFPQQQPMQQPNGMPNTMPQQQPAQQGNWPPAQAAQPGSASPPWQR